MTARWALLLVLARCADAGGPPAQDRPAPVWVGWEAPPRFPPVAASGRPGVPVEVRESAASSAPKLRLVRIERGATWEEHRALFDDDGDVRAYASFDLLPHGGVLVAIGEDDATAVLGDAWIFRFSVGGDPQLVADLRPRPEIRPQKSPSRSAFDAELAAAVAALSSGDDAERAWRTLRRAGEAAVPFLIDAVLDPTPVTGPRIEEEPWASRVLGDRAIGLLEVNTGQSLGNPTGADRAAVARAWRRWAGT